MASALGCGSHSPSVLPLVVVRDAEPPCTLSIAPRGSRVGTDPEGPKDVMK